jgi:hypothetical protein
MVKSNSDKLTFFWIFYTVILLEAIYNIVGYIFPIKLSLGGILGWILLILSFFALYIFTKYKLAKITKIVPISQIAFYGVIAIIAVTSFLLTKNNLPIRIESLGLFVIILSIGFNVFKVIMSLYVIKKLFTD